MKAVEIPRVGQAVLIEMDPPLAGLGEMAVAVGATGICGSDISAYKGRHPYRIPPVITGHEVAGVITAVDSSVTGLRTGQRVIIEPHVGCGKCAYCLAGNYNLCHTKKVLGTPEWVGRFAQSIVVPASCVYPIPDQLSLEQAVLIEPLSVGVYAARNGRLKPGATVAILGSGTIGLLLLTAVLEYDPARVWCTDIKPFNLERARDLGATDTIDASVEPVAERLLEATSGHGVDVTVVAIAAEQAMTDALKATRRQGRVVVVATFGGPIPVDLQTLFYERQVIGTCMYVELDYRQAIELATRRRDDLDHLITHRIELGGLLEMLGALSEARVENSIKVVVTMEWDWRSEWRSWGSAVLDLWENLWPPISPKRATGLRSSTGHDPRPRNWPGRRASP